MLKADAGGADRLALAVLAQYRMATTGQMHVLLAPGVRVEQTRRRLAKLSAEGLVDRVTLPQAGRTRCWFLTSYGAQIASEWPELRGWQPTRTASDRTAARLRAGHALAVTETGLAFVRDARERGDICQPLDWIPEVYHSLGGGEAVIPDALLYYRKSAGEEDEGSMLRAFVEVDRATWDPSVSPPNSAPTPVSIGTYPRSRPGLGSHYRSGVKRAGGNATRSSQGCCSSWTAPGRPASEPASTPCTPPPTTRPSPTSHTTSPSSPPPSPASSTTAPAHPSGTRYNTPT